MKDRDFFLKPSSEAQKQYEALRYYFVEGATAEETAAKFGYTIGRFTTIVTEFNRKRKEENSKVYQFRKS